MALRISFDCFSFLLVKSLVLTGRGLNFLLGGPLSYAILQYRKQLRIAEKKTSGEYAKFWIWCSTVGLMTFFLTREDCIFRKMAPSSSNVCN